MRIFTLTPNILIENQALRQRGPGTGYRIIQHNWQGSGSHPANNDINSASYRVLEC
jgi:hypothetical protein